MYTLEWVCLTCSEVQKKLKSEFYTNIVRHFRIICKYSEKSQRIYQFKYIKFYVLKKCIVYLLKLLSHLTNSQTLHMIGMHDLRMSDSIKFVKHNRLVCKGNRV